jgi:hypothetical protein
MGKQIEKEQLVDCDFFYKFKFTKLLERFEQLWTMKASARESFNDWLIVSNILARKAEVWANACSELIENSIKYTPNGSSATVTICVQGNEISVETINSAKKENIEALRESLATLEAASDPRQVFAERLMNPVRGKSQLGLIKIIMETKGTLELTQAEAEEVVQLKLRIHAE